MISTATGVWSDKHDKQLSPSTRTWRKVQWRKLETELQFTKETELSGDVFAEGRKEEADQAAAERELIS